MGIVFQKYFTLGISEPRGEYNWWRELLKEQWDLFREDERDVRLPAGVCGIVLKPFSAIEQCSNPFSAQGKVHWAHRSEWSNCDGISLSNRLIFILKKSMQKKNPKTGESMQYTF